MNQARNRKGAARNFLVAIPANHIDSGAKTAAPQ